MRLPNNYGQVIKLSGKRRRPYAVRVKTGENVNGSPIYRYLNYFEKRNDALTFLGKYNDGQISISNKELSSVIFRDVFDGWITEREKYKTVSLKTHESYVCAFNQLKPLHNRIFSSITIQELQEQIDRYNGMSASTINKPIALLKSMYKYAIKEKYVTEDLSQYIIRVSANDKIDKHKAFTHEEILKIREEADTGNEDAMRIMIYIYTGFRASELLEMKVENVDLDMKRMIGGKKTENGKNRQVPIHNSIMKYVKHFYNPQNVYLFEEYGNQIKYMHFMKYHAQSFFKERKMEHTMHDTRHTCATLLKEYGCDELCRKRILGHAVTDLTDRVYTHIEFPQLLAEINKIQL